MPTTPQSRQQIRDFVATWTGRGYEKGESQKFWLELLTILGVTEPWTFIEFEDQVPHIDHTSFIDAYIPATRVMIEQKSLGKDLTAPIRQSDGSMLNPFQQAKRYVTDLPLSRHPRWIVTCNFAEFLIYDMERPNGEPACVRLADLERELWRLDFLVHQRDEALQQEMQVSLQAGELVGRLYDALLAQYIDPTAPRSLQSLNALCVRLVFCLYAEDAGLFPSHTAFHDYLAAFHPDNVRKALIDLFKMLDTPEAERDPYDRPDLLAFPYVNGGLFADETIEVPRFTPEILRLVLDDCSADFDWSGISPTIFGAVFESTLNPETRRSGGMHYTSIENIHKVIDPLFLDRLTDDLTRIEALPPGHRREEQLMAYQDGLAALTFLDPACGSGNFLTETFLSLRRLENRVIRLSLGGARALGGDFTPVKVGIGQFYGIEINDFAATVAKTALWIAESQMLKETEDIVAHDLGFLPLKSYTNITEGNALRLDWARVAPPDRLSYIMGNPPFIGARVMAAEQKADMLHVFGPKWRNVGNMDYVTGWYKLAADLMTGAPAVRTAFVSTNSICQGEQVASLWKPLLTSGLHIDFARRTFRWDSEAKIKAHVHCVIVSFSRAAQAGPCRIYDGELCHEARHINGYLLDGEDVFVESRTKPLCPVPEIGIGNKPIDGGNYLFTADEKEEFVKREPAAAPYFHPWYGSVEFIHRKPRWCLWLGECTPAQLNAMPLCKERVANVRALRLKSKSAGTRKLADTPTRFHVENMPKGTYIVIPQVSSHLRRYVPIDFFKPNVLCGDKVRLMPNATLYHFGILTSNVHMAWMRTVGCRLKSDYSYTINVVYNTFPWPEPTEAQRAKIEATAQAILDARDRYPDSSLADLYDEVTMPAELRRAHQANDRAVMEAYGFTPVAQWPESATVSALMHRYAQLTGQG